MKLREIIEDTEPLLVKLIRQRMAKGDTIIYNRVDDDYHEEHPKHLTKYVLTDVDHYKDPKNDDSDVYGDRTRLSWRAVIGGKPLGSTIPDTLMHLWAIRKVDDHTWEYYRAGE